MGLSLVGNELGDGRSNALSGFTEIQESGETKITRTVENNPANHTQGVKARKFAILGNLEIERIRIFHQLAFESYNPALEVTFSCQHFLRKLVGQNDG